MQRESMEFDVVIIGGGPSGLSASIKLKQLAKKINKDISICVLEKGSEIGAHILSGAVIDPIALNELFPEWRNEKTDIWPKKVRVKNDKFLFLTKNKSFSIPNFLLPPLMSNHGNYIVSLGNVCRWLSSKAEELGVEIITGFSGAEVLYDSNGRVKGVATGDMGIGPDGQKTKNFEPGIELLGKYTLIAEGARGSLAKQIISTFNLDKNSDPQKFGLGIKELWEVSEENHKEGEVSHTLGWPLSNDTGGGAFIYHLDKKQVSIGFVVHLNYKNPYLSPFQEFQRLKHHPAISKILNGGKRISYGARVITEGGIQSLPDLVFPGGALIGCSAGFVNVPRIKGTHNAMKSGMLAAESIIGELESGQESELYSFQKKLINSNIYKDLYRVRNIKPLLTKFGTIIGMVLGGIDMWMNNLKIGLPLTLRNTKEDADTLTPANKSKPINYPKPDMKISFDKLSSVFISNTNHKENQPSHLQLTDSTIPIEVNLPKWAEPAQNYCPAGVYEIITDGKDNNKFQINAQNCVHCKTCDIKDPSQNIVWITPEGMGGPNYPNM